MGKFDGKVVIVTGASSGIGKATAIAFAKEGANLVLTGRNQERLVAAAKSCEDAGAKTLEVICDLADKASMELIINKTVEKFGSLDVLINNAGTGNVGTIEQIDFEGYDKVVNANIRAPIFLCKFAIPHLRKTRGCIVNVSSVLSSKCIPGFVTYCMTKAALDHFTRGLATECSADGIRVNTINPGVVQTNFMANLLDEESLKMTMDANREAQPLGLLDPQDIVDGILYLCQAKKVTGSSLAVDGGYLLTK